MPYRCLFDDPNEPVLLVTNLVEGDTLAVCGPHLGDWAASFVQAVTGLGWVPVTGSVPDQETGEESDEDDAADGAPTGPPAGPPETPGGRPAGPAEPGPEPDPEPGPEPGEGEHSDARGVAELAASTG